MVEIVVMCYAVVYVLWLLAMLACGKASRFFSVTMFFVLLPLLVAAGLALFVVNMAVGVVAFLAGMVITPFVLFFSKEARSEFIRKMGKN